MTQNGPVVAVTHSSIRSLRLSVQPRLAYFCNGWQPAGGGIFVRLFLSYGHDQNAPLVERIRADLEAAGYETWIDRERIKAGR